MLTQTQTTPRKAFSYEFSAVVLLPVGSLHNYTRKNSRKNGVNLLFSIKTIFNHLQKFLNENNRRKELICRSFVRVNIVISWTIVEKWISFIRVQCCANFFFFLFGLSFYDFRLLFRCENIKLIRCFEIEVLDFFVGNSFIRSVKNEKNCIKSGKYLEIFA